MQFRKWIMESKKEYQDWLRTSQADITDTGKLLVMADNLDEIGESDMADYLRMVVSYMDIGRGKTLYDPDERERLGVYEPMKELDNKIFKKLADANISISPYNNEIWDHREGYAPPEAKRYYWLGTHLIGPDGNEMDVDDIDDPLILEAVAYLLAQKLFHSRHGEAGLPRASTQRERIRNREGWEGAYMANREDSILRSYLEPMLNKFVTVESRLNNVMRLRRNQRVFNDLENDLSYMSFDFRNFFKTIDEHLDKYKSPFLYELLNRLNEFLRNLENVQRQNQETAILVGRPVTRFFRELRNFLQERLPIGTRGG